MSDELTTVRMRKKSLARFRLVQNRLEILRKRQLRHEDVMDEMLDIVNEELDGVRE